MPDTRGNAFSSGFGTGLQLGNVRANQAQVELMEKKNQQEQRELQRCYRCLVSWYERIDR